LSKKRGASNAHTKPAYVVFLTGEKLPVLAIEEEETVTTSQNLKEYAACMWLRSRHREYVLKPVDMNRRGTDTD